MSHVVSVDTTYPDFEEEVLLGTTTFRLRFIYNGRDDSWYLSVYGADGGALVLGVRLRLEEPVLAPYVGEDLPDGVLLVSDPAGDRIEPGRDGLTDGSKAVCFVESSELP